MNLPTRLWSQTLLCCEDKTPGQRQRNRPGQRRWTWDPVLRRRGWCSHEHPRVVTPRRRSRQGREEREKEELAAAEKAATQEELRVNVLQRLLS